MAIIRGQMFGDTSGKLGGMVFGRNKAGKTIRSYVVPTDAQSSAQVSHRTSFAQAISRWSSISDLARSAWNTFASSIFKPKKSKATSAYTGYQAFSSLNNILMSVAKSDYGALATSTTIDLDTGEWLSNVLAAPIDSFSAMIKSSTDTPVAISLKSFSLDSATGACVAVIAFNPAPQASAPVFENPTTNKPVGLAFYGSQILAPGANSCGNYEFYSLGSVPPIGSITGWSSANDLSISWTISSDYLESLKQGIGSGVNMFITGYAVSDDGQTAKIGMIKITTT